MRYYIFIGQTVIMTNGIIHQLFYYAISEALNSIQNFKENPLREYKVKLKKSTVNMKTLQKLFLGPHSAEPLLKTCCANRLQAVIWSVWDSE